MPAFKDFVEGNPSADLTDGDVVKFAMLDTGENAEATLTAVAAAPAFAAQYVSPDVVMHAATGTVSIDKVVLADAVSDCPEGGLIWMPANGDTYYATDTPWFINKHCTVQGASMIENFKSVASGGGTDGPKALPPLLGAVVMQTAAGADAVQLSGAAKNVNLKNLGVVFHEDIMFVDTGHGINADGGAYLTKRDSGVMHGQWENVTVFGHDGDHYAFRLVNPILSTFKDLRGYGGGGVFVVCDSDYTNYGNAVFIHPYMHVFCAGSAHGYYSAGSGTTSSPGVLNFMTWIRPQVNMTNLESVWDMTTAPTIDQYFWHEGTGTTKPLRVRVIDPDFEAPSIEHPVTFGTGTKVQNAGIIDTPNVTFRMMETDDGLRYLDDQLRFRGKNSGAPTVTIQAAAGAGASVSLVSGDDLHGQISITAGSSGLSAGTWVVFTFADMPAAPRTVNVWAIDSGAAVTSLPYAQGVSASGWNLKLGSSPTAGATLKYNYKLECS